MSKIYNLVSIEEHVLKIFTIHLFPCYPLYLRYAAVPLLSGLRSATYLFSTFIEAYGALQQIESFVYLGKIKTKKLMFKVFSLIIPIKNSLSLIKKMFENIKTISFLNSSALQGGDSKYIIDMGFGPKCILALANNIVYP